MKCIFIYNPKSGNGRILKYKTRIILALSKKYSLIHIVETKKRGDAEIAAKLSCGEYDTIVCAGGDGTLNEVVNGVSNCETRPTIGYIPTGTVNDLAHSLNISKNINKSLNIILKGNTINHDIFKINDRYGIYVSGFGLFTSCSYTASQISKKIWGKLSYYANGLKELKNAKNFQVHIKFGDTELKKHTLLCLVVNSKYVGGYKINKLANHDDGYVNLVVLHEKKECRPTIKSLFNIARLFLFGMKSLNHSKNCTIVKLNQCHIEMDKKIIINIDGEKSGNGSFDLKVLPQHLKIFVK